MALTAGCGPGLFVSEEGRGVYAAAAGSVVAVEASAGQSTAVGSGVVVTGERVLTACHVLGRVSSIRVRHGGRAYPAQLTGAEPGADLCQLSVPGLPARPVPVGNADTLEPGAALYALAIPGGYQVELSEGRFSGTVGHQGQNLLQTTARFEKGWSGGGLFAANGELVGILSFLLESPAGDLNYAVPADAFSPGASVR